MKEKKDKQKNAPVQQDVQVEATDAEQSGEISCEQVEAANEIAVAPKRQRVWEVDFVRGLMILFVVWDHFMWDVNEFGAAAYNTGLFQWLYNLSVTYYSGSLRTVTQPVFVTLFVFTSGVSCSFSKSNIMRALKMCAFALAFTLITDVISSVIGAQITIYFNVIHVVALSVLIYSLLELFWSLCKKNWQKNIFGVVFFAITMTALIVGACASHMHTHWTNVFFGESEWRTAVIRTFYDGADYLSFLPDFGWFLVGAVLGKALYRERKSIFPSVNDKFVSPVTFCGRHSLWVYFISQIVMYGLIFLLHEMFNII